VKLWQLAVQAGSLERSPLTTPARPTTRDVSATGLILKRSKGVGRGGDGGAQPRLVRNYPIADDQTRVSTPRRFVQCPGKQLRSRAEATTECNEERRRQTESRGRLAGEQS
jgi:hypothetical protein